MAQAKAEQMYAQALAEFPFECCGMIIGPEAEDIGIEDVVRPCRNVQQELHQEAQERGWVVKVCYHSHPNTGAYFSQEDRRNAEGWDLWFPGVRFVVISTYAGEIREMQGYRWHEPTQTFVSVPVDVCE